MRYNHSILALAILFHAVAHGQEPIDSLVGAIKPADFHPASHVIDSNADVVVLADVARAELADYGVGWQIGETRYKRLLIRDKNGFDAAKAEVSFDPYGNGDHKLASLRANTYNLEGGKVIRTALDTADCFLDGVGSGTLTEKWTFPDLKEGSIIEYTYTIVRNSIFDFLPWKFQGKYPRLWSSYTMVIPALFNYLFTKRGNLPVTRHDTSVAKTLQVGQYAVKTAIFTIHWEAKDVPRFVEEPDMPSPDDYEAGISFQLLDYTNLTTRRRVKVTNTWGVLTDRLYKNKAFGGIMNASGHWFRKDMRAIVADTASELDKAREIYAYVRDHFTVTGSSEYSDDDVTLRQIFKAKKGSVMEVNLVLAAMLREAGLNADAVVLSTKGNGLLDRAYPLIENLNYLVVRLRLGVNTLFLDATDPRQGFGHLPLDCYNGYARVVSQTPDSVIFSADSLVENRASSLSLYNNENGDSLVGDYTAQMGFYESQDIRDAVAAKSEDDYFDKVRRTYPFDVSLTDKHADGLKDFDGPVTLHYSIGFSTGTDDRIYFNPMLIDGLKENLTAGQRQYPVEMPYRLDYVYVLRMEVPHGYDIEELPKPVRVILSPGDGTYEYAFRVADSTIQFRSRLRLNRTYFDPGDYQPLRNFLDAVLKKQAESIVFRKKK